MAFKYLFSYLNNSGLNYKNVSVQERCKNNEHCFIIRGKPHFHIIHTVF